MPRGTPRQGSTRFPSTLSEPSSARSRGQRFPSTARECSTSSRASFRVPPGLPPSRTTTNSLGASAAAPGRVGAVATMSLPPSTGYLLAFDHPSAVQHKPGPHRAVHIPCDISACSRGRRVWDGDGDRPGRRIRGRLWDPQCPVWDRERTVPLLGVLEQDDPMPAELLAPAPCLSWNRGSSAPAVATPTDYFIITTARPLILPASRSSRA